MANVRHTYPAVDDAHCVSDAPSARALPAWLTELCLSRRLPWLLVVTALLLTSQSLVLGFHLDDYVHRYLLSDLPGARDLERVYGSPFGVANGEPTGNRWQVEHGYAPWWIAPDLLLSLWRPVSHWTHQLDATLWPDSAIAMHAHNLLWLALLIYATTRLYRRVLGEQRVIAGLAALFYAVSHTHGFAVGWIANRNALVMASFGMLTLIAYVAGRQGSRLGAWAASPLFLTALLAGEGAVAVFGYVIAHALFVDSASPRARLRAVAPHFAVLLAWRVAYNVTGHGAHGSGLYIDPVREPLALSAAALTRVPMLVMGQLALPPAESYVLGPPQLQLPILVFALFVSALFVVAVVPLLRHDAHARAWSFGMLIALVLNCTTYANNRLLFFVGLGAFAPLAQLWVGYVERARWLPQHRLARALGHTLVGAAALLHLFVSPLLLPLTTRSVAFTRPINPVLSALGRDPALTDHELLLLSAPEYFYVKLLPVVRALEHQPAAAAIHALSFGPVPLAVTRVDRSTLDVDYEGGILPDITTELYRRRDRVMHAGQRFDYTGCAIEVLHVTREHIADRVRFRFAHALDDSRYLVKMWDGTTFVDATLPAIGTRRLLPLARLPLAIP